MGNVVSTENVLKMAMAFNVNYANVTQKLVLTITDVMPGDT